MNEYDSSRLADLVRVESGLQSVAKAEEADVLLMNTCSIREKAQEKVFSELGRWRRLKEKNPDLIIGVGGCVASQEGDMIRQRAPVVDLVFGPQTLHRVPDMLAGRMSPKRKDSGIPVVDVTFPEIEKFDRLPAPSVDGVSAFVTIMEGCSKYCSFCVVPYTRGDEVNRPSADVLTEVQQLTEGGVREIVLLGQNVNSWLEGDRDLAWLIRAVAAVEGVARIRYTTSHPLDLSDSLIRCHAEVPELVRHLHLPVQSGSDAVLQAMKRHYTADDYRRRIDALRQQCPGMQISSDFIVGFPGETEADFAQTLQLVRDVGFDTSYSFLYSPRPGTPAAALEDDTAPERRAERLQELQALLTEQEQAISQSMLHSNQHCLVTDFSLKDPGQMQARTENQRVVNFQATDPDLIGQFVDIHIEEVLPHSLRGQRASRQTKTQGQTPAH